MTKILIEHNAACENRGRKLIWDTDLYPCRSNFIAFQYDFEFFLLVTHDCTAEPLGGWELGDWIFGNLEDARREIRESPSFSGVAYGKNSLRNMIRKNSAEMIIHQHKYSEIVYFYGQYQERCFCKDHFWIDILEKQEKYHSQYKEIPEELTKLQDEGLISPFDSKYLQESFNKLYFANMAYVNDWQVVKIGENFTKQFNSILKRGKNESNDNNIVTSCV